ncbi:hypothetical protein [Hymenobacter metallicola]|uniref:Uncharacterized protein n=1 Tax=Hymenobacter metallicola TaxID=2563114 RepID=A0A4Z0PVI2_9BACT|nr:hypothetical protein [Hymenobacter metallicola]TGE20991.1 hypothetical protein E5K02_24825 [Hymenobacter metallicola]
MVTQLMKCLLVGWVCVVPLAAAAQYELLGHAQRYRLVLPLPAYTSLADTALGTPLVYQPGQVVTVKGLINARWWVLSEWVGHHEVNRYFLVKTLVANIAEPPQPMTSWRELYR